MNAYDELVRDAVDLHVHVDLEFSATAYRKVEPEWRWLPRAEASGMRAVVLKSHLWPTTSTTHYLARLYQGSVAVHSSITLNPAAGGLDPWVVEAAAAQGARAVFLPTWGAEGDRVNGGFHTRLASHFRHFDVTRAGGLSLAGEDGRLRDTTQEILRLCAEQDLLLATGHSAWQETLALCRAARAIRFGRLLFNHPLSQSVQAPWEAIKEAVRLGAAAEFCWPTIAPGRTAPAEVVSLIRDLGPESVVLSSDFFGGSNPPPPDLLRLLLGTLYDAGLPLQDVRTCAATVPARLLGLDPL